MRHPPVKVTDSAMQMTKFLISKNIEETQSMLQRVEEQCIHIGLNTNSKKTEAMYFGIEKNQHIHTILNNEIKIVDNFKYLDSWMVTT